MSVIFGLPGTGTGTVRWRAEGASLGSQSELSPELMSPSRIRRRRRRSWLAKKRFFYLCPCPPQLGGGRSGRAGGGGLRGAVLWSHTRALLHNQTMHYRYAFHAESLLGEVRSPPSIYFSFSLSYFSKEVEVRDKFPVTIFCLSVSLSVITGCVTFFPRGNLLHSS